MLTMLRHKRRFLLASLSAGAVAVVLAASSQSVCQPLELHPCAPDDGKGSCASSRSETGKRTPTPSNRSGTAQRSVGEAAGKRTKQGPRGPTASGTANRAAEAPSTPERVEVAPAPSRDSGPSESVGGDPRLEPDRVANDLPEGNAAPAAETAQPVRTPVIRRAKKAGSAAPQAAPARQDKNAN